MDYKELSIKDFRALGFVQELNRSFLHPLGLALAVSIDDDGEETLGPIYDFREDPVGVIYSANSISKEKRDYVSDLRCSKARKRIDFLGEVVQDSEDIWK